MTGIYLQKSSFSIIIIWFIDFLAAELKTMTSSEFNRIGHNSGLLDAQRKPGIVRINGHPSTLEELATLKEANWVEIFGTDEDVVLPDGFVVDDLFLGECKGKIQLGKHMRIISEITISDCPQVTSLPENLNIGGLLIVEGCEKFERIEAGLTYQPTQKHLDRPDGYGVGLRISRCAQFRTIEGPATLQGFLSVGDVPLFEGLAPEIQLDKCRKLFFLEEVSGIAYDVNARSQVERIFRKKWMERKLSSQGEGATCKMA